MAPQRETVFVVYHMNESGEVVLALACSKSESAEAAAQKMQDNGKTGVRITQISLIDAKVDMDKATTKSKNDKENDNTATNQDEDTDTEEAPAKPKKAAKKASSKKAEEIKAAREVIPDGEPGSLEGLKFIFSGTMSMNRKIIEQAATTYGGEVGNPNKLDEADWIVLGTKPGPKKLEEIDDKNLKTMTEAQFLEMLKGYGEPVQEPRKKKLKT